MCAQGHSRFKVRTLSRGHARLAEPCSSRHRFTSRHRRSTSPSGCRRHGRGVTRSRRNRHRRFPVRFAVRPGTTGTNVCTAREPPRRCGYTQRVESLHLSRQTGRRSTAGWHGGERTRRRNHGDRVAGVAALHAGPILRGSLPPSVRTSGANRHIGTTPPSGGAATPLEV